MIRETIGDAWAGAYAVVDVRVEAPPPPHAAAAFVITGSAAHVHHRDPWVLATEAWLREVVAHGAPVLGICFGHQLLAQALGGDVKPNPRGREIGTIRVTRRVDDPLFAETPSAFDTNATHLDSVVAVPKGAVSLAFSDDEAHHALRFAENVYGVQFHPEFDGDILRGYLEARRAACEAEGIDVAAKLSAARDTPHGRALLPAFVRRFARD
jgi:GMP synthase (glutamine-hydrolysing)